MVNIGRMETQNPATSVRCWHRLARRRSNALFSPFLFDRPQSRTSNAQSDGCAPVALWWTLAEVPPFTARSPAQRTLRNARGLGGFRRRLRVVVVEGRSSKTDTQLDPRRKASIADGTGFLGPWTNAVLARFVMVPAIRLCGRWGRRVWSPSFGAPVASHG